MKTSSRISVHESGFQEPIPLKDREYVVGYARVSSARQGGEKSFGLDFQKRAIFEYCKAHSLVLHDIYTDVISGTEASLVNRASYWEMLAYSKKANIKKIITVDISRMFRDTATTVLIKKSLFALSMDIISINQPNYTIYENDPSGFLVNSLLDAITSYERQVLVSRLKAARLEKSRQGRFSQGGVSTGLQVLNRELVVDEEEIKIVKLIFRLRKRGFTPYAIAKFLNVKKIPGKQGGTWFPTGVKRILKNKIYKGYIKHGKNFYKSQLGKLV